MTVILKKPKQLKTNMILVASIDRGFLNIDLSLLRMMMINAGIKEKKVNRLVNKVILRADERLLSENKKDAFRIANEEILRMLIENDIHGGVQLDSKGFLRFGAN